MARLIERRTIPRFRPHLPLLFALFPATAAHAEEPEPSHFAVVVGLSTFELLPHDLAPQAGGRADAAAVADALEGALAFDEVRLLTDAAATRAGLEAVLSQELGARVGPEDLFFLYFTGPAVGGDFGEPRLLLYDTDPDLLQRTSYAITELGADLSTWIAAERVVVITDTSFEGQVGGLALMGPTPDQWPAPAASSMILSSTAPREISQPGVFGPALVEGLSGEADRSGDGRLTSGELSRFLVTRVPEVSGDAQHPTVDPRTDPSFELGELTAAARGLETGPPTVDKVKVVFRGGVSSTLACGQDRVVVCEPRCYLFEVPEGTCEASAVIGDSRKKATFEVTERGRWVCSAQDDGQLACQHGS